jgi:anti-sigma regulatory factor (Ser/Thr protein kinase)
VRATHLQARTDQARSPERSGRRFDARADGGATARRSGRGPGISVELEPGANAASEARAALAALDGVIDAGSLDDIRLLASELVTNSVRHSGAAGVLVRLDVESHGRTTRVEVSDGGRGFEPRARDPRPRADAHDEVGGWGLHLVDRIAARWGVQTGRRTRVWFELDA